MRFVAMTIAAVVASCAMGLAAVHIGTWLDGVPDRLPTGDTYTYHRTTACPTEDSCDRFGFPVTP